MRSSSTSSSQCVGSSLWYQAGFLSESEERSILAQLEAVPVRPFDCHDPRLEFAFTQLVINGHAVTGRLEAAAGAPIWWGDSAVAGTPLPGWSIELSSRCERWVDRVLPGKSRGRFSSMYVDRYDPGGTFASHTDRSCYGPIIAGISVGPGNSTLRFSNCSDQEQSVEIHLQPRSVYAFTGTVREPPWEHEIIGVTDTRYAVTFRTSS